MTVQITEALGAAQPTTPGRIKATLITPGVGSSGTYSADVLEQAAIDKVFARGTQMHINHNTELEDINRPEGDLRNLAGVLIEDAYWDGNALVAEARISSAWKDFISEFGEFIGVSISAQAEINETGDITKFLSHPFNRADFVTAAGRGGEVTEILEAAKVVESRSMVKETTDRDIGMWLNSAIRDTVPGWSFVTDHDSNYVYYEADDDNGREHFYRRSYTLDGSTITLGQDPVQVRRRTEYDPVQVSSPEPAGITEHNSKETMMVDIDQAQYDALQEKARRSDELAAELQELKETQAAQAAESRKEKALAAVREAYGDDAPRFFVDAAESAASDEGFDHEAFRTSVLEAASVTGATEAGTPNLGGGAGGTDTVTETKTVTDEDIVKAF